MAPRAFRIAAGAGGVVGRGVPAQAVEAAIVNGTKRIQMVKGVLGIEHMLDGLHVITEDAGRIVIL